MKILGHFSFFEGSTLSNTEHKSVFIRSFYFDSFYFLLSPLLCLLFVISVMSSPFMTGEVEIFSHQFSRPLFFLLSALTTGHVISVFYRSYLNRKVFEKHKKKILLVPPIAILGLAISFDFLVLAGVAMIFWQMYHYALQHFGLIKIYDSKVKNFSKFQRRLDIIACIGFVFLPIFVGTTKFMQAFDRFLYLEKTIFSFAIPFLLRIADFIEGNKTVWLYSYFSLAGIYFFVLAYGGMRKKNLSIPKLVLMLQIFFVFSFGFMFFQPFVGVIALDLLHSVQYYGLLSLSERSSTSRVFGLSNVNYLQPVTLGAVVFLGLGFGIFSVFFDDVPASPPDMHWTLFPFAIVIGVNCLHFWMDSFIWGRDTEL
jgi:hypothetical protein